MTEKEWMEKLEREGFTDIVVCPNGPDTEFPEHTHNEHTVHVILKGDFTLIEEGGTRTLHEGERFEIPAGTTHRARCESAGCTFIVGVKARRAL